MCPVPLLSEFGFDVEVTQATRDGGKDIVAIKNDETDAKFLIECKRFVPTNKVGIAAVQRLHGVAVAEGARKAILVTTSSLTRPARKYLENQWVLDACEFDGILDWLKQYQESLRRKVLELDNLAQK